MKNGWAVKYRGDLDMRTVSPTRRAAIVNWLVVGPKILIMNNDTDEMIEKAWISNHGPARVVEVNVTEVTGLKVVS